jgi:6-pyruvoyltetrahydropterin/6-carboxytetrahydropterin synthase
VTSITRVYRFSASHRLHTPQRSDAENAALFGKCNNPHGHGHDYVLSVTAGGRPDPRSGLLLCVEEVDHLVRAKVLNVFSHRNMNVDIPQFQDVVPTTENVVLIIAGLLEESWHEFVTTRNARLYRVHIQETERNGFEILLPARPAKQEIESEGLLAHA